MARFRKTIKNPFITLIPTSIFKRSLPSSLTSPRKSPKNHAKHLFAPRQSTFTVIFLSVLISFTFMLISFLRFVPSSPDSLPCSVLSSPPFPPSPPLSTSRTLLASLARNKESRAGIGKSVLWPLPLQGVSGNVSEEERKFWEQPVSEAYKPCLEFSIKYRKKSRKISKEKRKFLVVVASGGLNQQRNQIVDAVVIARILEAALVVPVLQVNPIWGDDSEFSDIFDVEHFKKTLKADVRVVSSLPSTHIMSRQYIDNQIPYDVSPLWIRARFYRVLNREGVIVLKALDSKLSKNLPLDLQKLRCKVAFHALKFAAPLEELGNRLARRMWIEGPYIALHLRLEKDVWVRSGCLTGLGSVYDNIIIDLRQSNPEYLTGKQNMSYMERRLAGQCPLNAKEMARFLKALGAPSSARIYIAGGEPFGGARALHPLANEFRNLVTRDMLAKEGELLPYQNKSSSLTAIDYIVSLSSNVFLPSHGGNMGRVMQGHRAYVGHRKYIKPNKRAMIPYFEDSSISEEEFRSTIKSLHKNSQGQPEPRNNKRDRNVIAYPIPECMCRAKRAFF